MTDDNPEAFDHTEVGVMEFPASRVPMLAALFLNAAADLPENHRAEIGEYMSAHDVPATGDFVAIFRRAVNAGRIFIAAFVQEDGSRVHALRVARDNGEFYDLGGIPR